MSERARPCCFFPCGSPQFNPAVIGDFLYELTPRDSVSAGLELVVRNQQVVGNIAALTSDFQVPFERIMRLSNARIACSPGAGQGVTIANIVLILPDTGVQVLLCEPLISAQGAAFQAQGVANLISSAGGAAVDDTIVVYFNSPVLLPGGSILRANAGFTLGVVANTLNFSFLGYTMPRGNVVF